MTDFTGFDGRVQFEPFELDLRSRELVNGSRRTRLQDQPFEILRMMLDRPGQVVTRDELRRRLWPEGTFVDFEHSLNAAVKRLRAALGDEADRPRFVETIPRRGYRFIAAVGRRTRAADAESIDHRARLAVLPFTNLSGDPGQEYFSDGLTDEMIAQLGRLIGDRVGVIARWSSMKFKGSPCPAREIGQVLRADYLLEGTVRRDGDRVRVTAALVEVSSETHLWTDTSDHRVGEGFLSLQVDVAARIARSLQMELAPIGDRAPRHGSSVPMAYQAFLKGRYYWNKPGSDGLAQAIAYFEEALRLDPSFPAASASLARAHVSAAEYYIVPPAAAFLAARHAAEHALAHDPNSADALAVIGDVRRMVQWDWEGADEAYRQALASNPSSDAAHRKRASLLAATGRVIEAKQEAQRALALDPLCLVVGVNAAWVSYLAGAYSESIDQCGIVLEMDPGFAWARRVCGAALLGAGRVRDAMAQLEAAAADGTDPPALSWLAHAKARAGDRRGAAEMLARARERHGAGVYASPYHAAMAHDGLGDTEAALCALERAMDERDPAITDVLREPRFENVRRDDRFWTIAERLRLGHDKNTTTTPNR